MKRYRFNQTLLVECVPYTAGAIVEESKIPSGSLKSMLRLGQVSEYTESAPVAAATPAPEQPAASPVKKAAKK